MKSRVEKLVRRHRAFRREKENMYMILSVRMYIMISSRRHIPMRSLDLWDRALASAKALQKQ